MQITIPPNAAAVDEDGREVIFADGEENVEVVGFDARFRTIEFRLYGQTMFIHQDALRPGLRAS